MSTILSVTSNVPPTKNLIVSTGVEHFKNYQDTHLEKEEHYIRVLKKFENRKGDFQIGLCMFPGQSRLFKKAKWATADTSFKRFKGYDEFGIEFWDEESKRCASYAIFSGHSKVNRNFIE